MNFSNIFLVLTALTLVEAQLVSRVLPPSNDRDPVVYRRAPVDPWQRLVVRARLSTLVQSNPVLREIEYPA